MEFGMNELNCVQRPNVTIVYFGTRGKSEAFRHELNLESRAEVGQWLSLENYLICYHTIILGAQMGILTSVTYTRKANAL